MCRPSYHGGRRCPNCGNKPANPALRRPRDRSRDANKAAALAPHNATLKAVVEDVLSGETINQTKGTPAPTPTKVVVGRDKFLDLIIDKGGATPRLTLVDVTNPQPEDARYTAALDHTTVISDFIRNDEGEITKAKLGDGTILDLANEEDRKSVV